MISIQLVFISIFPTALAMRSAPPLLFTAGTPCDASNRNEPLNPLGEYQTSWPTQCDLLCTRFSQDGHSYPCMSWTWSKLTSKCALYDVAVGQCIDTSDLHSTWAAKRYVLDRSQHLQNGYSYSTGGSTIRITWEVCSDMDHETKSATCNTDHFGIYVTYEAQPIVTGAHKMYNMFPASSLAANDEVWNRTGEIWMYRRSHGGFQRAIKRSSSEGLYGCVFPEGFDLSEFEDDLDLDETAGVHLYICMDQKFCPDFVKFDMCFVEFNGCQPKLSGDCGQGASVLFTFFSAWVPEVPPA